MDTKRLGKKDYKHDPRTLMLARFMATEIRTPAVYDYDKGKTPLPLHMWGNDQWGDCVFAGRANLQVRLERIEQRRTIPLTDDTVVSLYKRLTGAQTPGDSNDEGYVILEALRQWKNEGWDIGGKNYKIAAYGELDPADFQQLKSATYFLHGVTFGFALPNAAQAMTDAGKWDYNGETSPDFAPGSWGGHCVFSKAYTREGMKVLTWGREILVTWNFIKKYCDEAWAVVDALDTWKIRQTIDVTKLTEELGQISHKVNQ